MVPHLYKLLVFFWSSFISFNLVNYHCFHITVTKFSWFLLFCFIHSYSICNFCYKNVLTAFGITRSNNSHKFHFLYSSEEICISAVILQLSQYHSSFIFIAVYRDIWFDTVLFKIYSWVLYFNRHSSFRTFQVLYYSHTFLYLGSSISLKVFVFRI